jgi:hypothetical protein
LCLCANDLLALARLDASIVYPGVYPSGFLLIGHFQQSQVPQAQTQFLPPFVRSTP